MSFWGRIMKTVGFPVLLVHNPAFCRILVRIGIFLAQRGSFFKKSVFDAFRLRISEATSWYNIYLGR